MKLVTFQSIDAVKDLLEKGYLECNSSNININKVGYAYNWITEKMNELVKNEFEASYPVWCWVKCYNGITPAKRKGESIKGYDVKITFNKNKEEVFITDYKRYSFVLNNIYIPENNQDKINFDKKLESNNITKEELEAYVRQDKYTTHRTDTFFLDICSQIRKSFDRCITEESDILQGCVWRINLKDIEKIEFLKKDNYIYGSINYIRNNGKRKNWIEDYYKNIKRR